MVEGNIYVKAVGGRGDTSHCWTCSSCQLDRLHKPGKTSASPEMSSSQQTAIIMRGSFGHQVFLCLPHSVPLAGCIVLPGDGCRAGSRILESRSFPKWGSTLVTGWWDRQVKPGNNWKHPNGCFWKDRSLGSITVRALGHQGQLVTWEVKAGSLNFYHFHKSLRCLFLIQRFRHKLKKKKGI